MGSHTTQLILQFLDQASGPAKKTADNLKAVQKALTDKQGRRPLLSTWGEDFQGQIDKMKLTARELVNLQRSYDQFYSGLRGKRAADIFRQQTAWQAQAIRGLREMRAEHERLDKMQHGAGRIAGRVIGYTGGAYAVQRGLRSGTRATSQFVREDARDYLAGLSAEETARVRARSLALSGQYPSIDAASLHERIRDTAMSMSSLDKAMSMSDTIAKSLVVLQSLKGKDQAMDEQRQFFKALDTMGMNQDTARVERLASGFLKALSIEGSDFNLGHLYTFAKFGRSAASNLSDRFLTGILPSLMMDMGPSQAGTALMTLQSQTFGTMLAKASKREQERLGLRDKKGNIKNGALLQADPMQWAQDVLIPALKKAKIDVDDDKAVARELTKLFSTRMPIDLMTKLVTQADQYLKKEAAQSKAKGTDAAAALQNKDPFVAAAGLGASVKNLTAVLAEPVLAPAIRGINSLTSAINSMAEAASKGQVQGVLKEGGEQAGYLGGVLGLLGVGGAATKGGALFSGLGATTSGAAITAAGTATTFAAGAALPWAWHFARRQVIEDAKNHRLGWQKWEPKAWPFPGNDPHQDFTLGNTGGFQKRGYELARPGQFNRIGKSFSDVIGYYGTPATQNVQALLSNQSEFAEMGRSSIDAYSQSVLGGLLNLEKEAREILGRIKNSMQLNVSPTITPKVDFAPAQGRPAPSQEARRAPLHGTYHDFGIGEVA